MYQVDSEDANFLFLEKTESPTHISLLYFYDQSDMEDGQVRFTHLRQHIDNRLNSANVFRQKVQRTPGDIDYPYWVDDESFDLDFHLRHLALPRPGDWRQFCIQVARLHSRPLDLSRPLWELYVIEGLDHIEGFPHGCFALYFKVHHCAMDEFTAQELLESIHAKTPVAGQHENSNQHIYHLPSKAPPPLEMLLRGVANNCLRSIRLAAQSITNARTLSRIATRMYLATAQDIIEGEETIPRFSQPLTPARVFEGGFYPRELLENYAAEVPGASFSHAVLAVCSETMRLYMLHHGDAGTDELQALLEVNVRNAGAHALVGNRIAINQIKLHTDVSYPLGRLQAIYATHEQLQSVEEQELTNFRLRSLYENLPAPLLSWMGRTAHRRGSLNHRIMRGGNMGLAELDGPDKPLYLLGAKLLGFTGISPLYSGCGLMFNASVYCDTVGITLSSDRSMMPDPEVMKDCLDQAIRGLDTHMKKPLARNQSGKAKQRV